MGYTIVALKDKIQEMYPEISEHGISVGLDFNSDLNTYDVTLRKNEHTLLTHISKEEADECMEGVKCVHLGVQIGDFINNFESER